MSDEQTFCEHPTGSLLDVDAQRYACTLCGDLFQKPSHAAAAVVTPARQAAPSKRCVFCAETILAAAIRCKHCGADLHAPAVRSNASLRLIIARVFFGGLVIWWAVITRAQWTLADVGQLPEILPVWNSIIVLTMVVVFFGLVARQKFSKGWAEGTSFVNGLSALHLAYSNGSAVLLLGAVLGGVTIASLWNAHREFDPAYDPNRETKHSRASIWISVALLALWFIVDAIASQPT